MHDLHVIRKKNGELFTGINAFLYIFYELIIRNLPKRNKIKNSLGISIHLLYCIIYLWRSVPIVA